MLAKQGKKTVKTLIMNKEVTALLDEEAKKLEKQGIKISFSCLIDIFIHKILKDIRNGNNTFKKLYMEYEKEVLIPEKKEKKEKSLEKRREREKLNRRMKNGEKNSSKGSS
ncbi:hypothetical protein AAA294_07455 [Fusobacterium varium]|uniref:hypothetical protein n=1 Tax=Fusobacterium varium TaxID=856 RepID=UPI0032C02BD0